MREPGNSQKVLTMKTPKSSQKSRLNSWRLGRPSLTKPSAWRTRKDLQVRMMMSKRIKKDLQPTVKNMALPKVLRTVFLPTTCSPHSTSLSLEVDM